MWLFGIHMLHSWIRKRAVRAAGSREQLEPRAVSRLLTWS